MTDMQKQSIRDMRQHGLSYSAIGETTDFSPNTIKSFCRRENIIVLKPSGTDGYIACKHCSKTLNHHPGKKKKRFCNDKCRTDWWNKNRHWANRKKAYQLICLSCGAVFESYGNKGRKYCGRDCYIRSRYGEGLP